MGQLSGGSALPRSHLVLRRWALRTLELAGHNHRPCAECPRSGQPTPRLAAAAGRDRTVTSASASVPFVPLVPSGLQNLKPEISSFPSPHPLANLTTAGCVLRPATCHQQMSQLPRIPFIGV